MKKLLHTLGLLLVCLNVNISKAQVLKSDFEDLILSPNTYYNGSEGSGNFYSGTAEFENTYDTEYDYWNGGFAYSNVNDNTTGDYTNLYGVITGTGYSGSGNYAVGQNGAHIYLTGDAVGTVVTGFYLTNSTYAALVMRNGNMFSKVFGGEEGDDPDFFKLTITGYYNDEATENTVEVYLADFRYIDNDLDYILENWRWVDLRSLGPVESLLFELSSSDVGDFGMNTPAFFCIDEFNAPLFSPLGGQAGSTAIHKDAAEIVNWASACTVDRGPQDISSGASPLTSVGTENSALGAAGTGGVLSLGDGGSAILTFEYPIRNGEGPDFAVFENGFTNGGNLLFAELAFVEVSSDGENFFRFPAISNIEPTTQKTNADFSDPQLIYNLAGSAQANYGTPFDLEDLVGTSGLDIDRITHVKIIDVVGSVHPAYANYDKNGNAVNDPWKTAFASCGFDLDAVGIMHQNVMTGIIGSVSKKSTLNIYPNPALSNVSIDFIDQYQEGYLELLDITGKTIQVKEVNSGLQHLDIDLTGFNKGVYLVKFNGETQQLLKQ